MLLRPTKHDRTAPRKPRRSSLVECLIFVNEATNYREQFADGGARIAAAVRDRVVNRLIWGRWRCFLFLVRHISPRSLHHWPPRQIEQQHHTPRSARRAFEPAFEH
jgi:hypothetical protein